MNNTHIVIMAGGIGSRLWPVSTPETPKQFIDLLGIGKTMIQLTMERFLPVCEPKNFWVVTSERYADMVREQLPMIPEEQILTEPEARNTAPCIAYACRKIAKHSPNANVVVTPSDALVVNREPFIVNLQKAIKAASVGDKIVTIGIKPNRPATGYGYIKACSSESGEVVKVLEFKEKPDLEKAKEYLASGQYFWNAGIFVWAASFVNSSIKKYAPQISEIMDELEPDFYSDREKESLASLFPQCEKISIDYAVMEKSDSVYVISEDLGWTDLGNWMSVKEQIPSSKDGNSVVGQDVRLIDCKNCVVHTDGGGTVVVEGLDGYIISEKNGNVVICHLDKEQKIKDYLQADENRTK